MGAHFALTIHEKVGLAANLRTALIPAYATSSLASAGLYELQLHGEVDWLFGHEGRGVADDLMALTTASMAIPHLGPVESLNVAASAAVCFSKKVRQKVAHRADPVQPAKPGYRTLVSSRILNHCAHSCSLIVPAATSCITWMASVPV